MIRYLLDTNTCIEYLRGNDQRLVRRIQAKRRRQVRICSVVVGELFDGVHRSKDVDKNTTLVVDLIETFTSLPFDDDAARVFGKLRFALGAAGTAIGPYDLQIASIALARGLILVTHNVDEFSRVHDLSIEDWQA